MRALVVADLHYSLKQFDWLLRVGPGYDQVVIAGDVLDIAAHVDVDSQVVVVTRYLAKLATRVPLIVCSGNHDADTHDAAGERVAAWLQELREEGVRVDGDQVLLPGALITVCPWWDGPVARERLAAMLEAVERPTDRLWIWIHHAPPDASPVSWTGRKHAGDAFLNPLIERLGPDLVLSGHVHESPFRGGGSWVDRIGPSWVFNPGRQLGELPAFIELDLGNATAGWRSLAGDADQSLR